MILRRSNRSLRPILSPVRKMIPTLRSATRVHTPPKLWFWTSAWKTLSHAVDADADNEWLITLMGARGFPLGEHGRIGGVDPRTHAEQLHVPWLVRFPDKLGQLTRVDALTSHHDLLPTLMDWIDRDGTDRSIGIRRC